MLLLQGNKSATICHRRHLTGCSSHRPGHGRFMQLKTTGLLSGSWRYFASDQQNFFSSKKKKMMGAPNILPHVGSPYREGPESRWPSLKSQVLKDHTSQYYLRVKGEGVRHCSHTTIMWTIKVSRGWIAWDGILVFGSEDPSLMRDWTSTHIKQQQFASLQALQTWLYPDV